MQREQWRSLGTKALEELVDVLRHGHSPTQVAPMRLTWKLHYAKAPTARPLVYPPDRSQWLSHQMRRLDSSLPAVLAIESLWRCQRATPFGLWRIIPSSTSRWRLYWLAPDARK